MSKSNRYNQYPSPKERKYLALYAKGVSVREIAQQETIKVHSVYSALHRAKVSLGAENTKAAAKMWAKGAHAGNEALWDLVDYLSHRIASGR